MPIFGASNSTEKELNKYRFVGLLKTGLYEHWCVKALGIGMVWMNITSLPGGLVNKCDGQLFMLSNLWKELKSLRAVFYDVWSE